MPPSSRNIEHVYCSFFSFSFAKLRAQIKSKKLKEGGGDEIEKIERIESIINHQLSLVGLARVVQYSNVL